MQLSVSKDHSNRTSVWQLTTYLVNMGIGHGKRIQFQCKLLFILPCLVIKVVQAQNEIKLHLP